MACYNNCITQAVGDAIWSQGVGSFNDGTNKVYNSSNCTGDDFQFGGDCIDASGTFCGCDLAESARFSTNETFSDDGCGTTCVGTPELPHPWVGIAIIFLFFLVRFAWRQRRLARRIAR